MSYIKNISKPKIKQTNRESKQDLTGIWRKCTQCKEIVESDQFIDNLEVCPKCGHHHRLDAKKRVDLLIDEGTFEPDQIKLRSLDPLEFFDKSTYSERLEKAFNKTGYTDSIIGGVGLVFGRKVSLAVMNFSFMGGSMGVVCGEMIARTMERSLNENIPCIVVTASGGARMQEGILSLMQMAKTSAVRQKLKEKNIPYISILTDPTTGGCAASFAMLGDINLSEPNSLIGFAGPRVIEQSIKQKLPEGFQRSEFLKEKGFIDRVVKRPELKSEVAFFLETFQINK